MIETAAPAERAYLVGLDGPHARFDVDDSLEELAALVTAAGGYVVGRTTQRRRAPDPNLWMGKGKVDEVAEEVRRSKVDLLVCDEELSRSSRRASSRTSRSSARCASSTALE